MALRVCPNCGTPCNGNAHENIPVCEECGFTFDTFATTPQPPERTKSIFHNKRLLFLIILAVIVCIALYTTITYFHRQNILRKIEALVQEGNYSDAYSLVDSKIYDSYSDNEAVEKAMVIGNLEWWYDHAQKGQTNKIRLYTNVVVCSIGCHQQLLDWGIYDYTEPMVLDSIQQIENLREKPWDGTTEYIIYKDYNDPDNVLAEPYRTENPDGANEYIQYLLSTIDYEQAEQIEKDRYNQKNPLQITEKSTYSEGDYWYCTGTLSNVSAKTYCYVKVKVTYYNSNMDILTTDWTYAVDSVGIEGGENIQFEIMTKVAGDVAKYKVEVIDYQ